MSIKDCGPGSYSRIDTRLARARHPRKRGEERVSIVDIPTGIEGRVTNSERPSHRVMVDDDRESTGGFLIFQWWTDSNGPNTNGAYDAWVESEEALEQFFTESGWIIQWTQP